MKESFLILLLTSCLLISSLHAQNRMEAYLEEGLANNLVLKEKNMDLEQSLLALKDAKSHFLPSMDFGATYNLANGGRSIAIPVGDLLNGVYGTLNQLTGSNQFPRLENLSEQFLPNNFYDARFRVSMPLLNPDLRYQKQARSYQVQISAYELEIYRANLIQDIKTAYYNFCTAYTAVRIIESSKELVSQNLRDNESLLQNGKGLPASVLRARSEVESINAMMIEAENRKLSASYYLNFLLNRPMDAEVEFEEQRPDWGDIETLLQEDQLPVRAELEQISSYQSIQEASLKSSRNYWIPRLSTFADFGSQAFDFQFSTTHTTYLFFGLNLSVPVFQGGRNKNNIQRSQLALQKVQDQKQQLDQKVAMELRLAINGLLSSKAAYVSSELKLESSKAYFRLVDRGFKEGSYSLIEFIDARNQYTQAGLEHAINAYALLTAQAGLERQLFTETN